jgi:hypothetical protein
MERMRDYGTPMEDNLTAQIAIQADILTSEIACQTDLLTSEISSLFDKKSIF